MIFGKDVDWEDDSSVLPKHRAPISFPEFDPEIPPEDQVAYKYWWLEHEGFAT